MKHKALKQRFYPSDEQKLILAQTFGCSRFVYNSILRWRTDAFYNDGKSIGYIDASKKLTEIKKNPEFSWLNDVSSVPLQQAIRNQQTAFKNFFAKRAKYPKFKKKQSRQSVQYMQSAYKWDGEYLKLAKMSNPLRIKWTYSKPENIQSLTVSMDSAGRYFVSMLVEFKPKTLQVSPKTIGVDLGIKDLIVCSDGFKSGASKLTKKYEVKLAYLQKQLAKKQKGSSNRFKMKRRVARVHAKVADKRRDSLHKLSRMLVNENQVIAFEDLAVSNMKKNRKLSKAISDMGWSDFVRMTTYKAEWAGREVVKIDRWYPSSKRMSCCGHVLNSLSLSQRKVTCPVCHIEHDRDINAAINIKQAGLAELVGDTRYQSRGATLAGVCPNGQT
jgi:putative transposase